jgi:Rhodopirellula transposase DDE domain
MPRRATDSAMAKLLTTLDEAQKRWFVGREAMLLGHGGLKRMCELSGLSKPTVIRGIRELKGKEKLRDEGRVRQAGGGRKPLQEQDPEALNLLQRIMEENTVGDPMSLLKWSSKSTYQIRDQLVALGHPMSEDTVARWLKELDYSLQANVKEREGSSPPERDSQFRYINALAKKYMARREPVISVDAKKKERVGAFKNGGRQWRAKGNPVEVNVYDYPSLAMGTAVPYGAYDLQRNQGLVNVGMSHDTAEFAVESIRRWWSKIGRPVYPKACRLLICADGGGSNGSRNRAWKYHLQELSDQIALEITVCHYPPGTSKWNKIEHRMFSFISMNWKGQPLASFETVINLISATKTRTGLNIRAVLDQSHYEKGLSITDEEMQKLRLRKHEHNPQWNYTLCPRSKVK